MVATMTVAAAVVGAVAVLFAYLVYALGMYRHSEQSGVVDIHDYQDTRLQILGNQAIEDVADRIDDENEQ